MAGARGGKYTRKRGRGVKQEANDNNNNNQEWRSDQEMAGAREGVTGSARRSLRNMGKEQSFFNSYLHQDANAVNPIDQPTPHEEECSKAGTRRSSRKRGKGKLEEQQADEETQEHAYANNAINQDLEFPGASFRHVTRRSNTILSSLRKPVRCIRNAAKSNLKETHDGGPVQPKSPKSTPQMPRENPVVHASAESADSIAPITDPTVDLDNLISLINNSNRQETRQVHCEPLKDHNPLSHCPNGPEKSINLTDFAKKLLEDEDEDPEEIESIPDPDHDFVHGHKVKKEIAPLLITIFKKYPDIITPLTDVKSSHFLSYFLERICDIYKHLNAANIHTINQLELNEMIEEVSFLESRNLNVKWLHERLEYVSNTKTGLKGYLKVKEELEKDEKGIGRLEKEKEVYEKEFSRLKREFCKLEQKLTAVRDELVVKRAKVTENKEKAKDIKARVSFLGCSLMNGLLI